MASRYLKIPRSDSIAAFANRWIMYLPMLSLMIQVIHRGLFVAEKVRSSSETVLTDTSCDNIFIVGEKSASKVGLENELVNVKYFTKPSDVFMKPFHYTHLHLFFACGLQADTCQVDVNQLSCRSFSLSALGVNFIILVTHMHKLVPFLMTSGQNCWPWISG